MEQEVSKLSEIPIKIEPAAPREVAPVADQGLGQGGSAILIELASLLEQLAQSNISGAIDLHSMPMTAADRTSLQDTLGQGEVRAVLQVDGISEVQETAIPGIWWVQHRNTSDEIIAELIEVTVLPGILARAHDEVAAGRDLLRMRIELSVSNRTVGGRPNDY
jgi:hydrogenase-1 operon protein HyaF